MRRATPTTTTLLTLAGTLVCARPALAQWSASVEAGPSHVRSEGVAGVTAFSVSPAVRWTRRGAQAEASVTGAWLDTGEGIAQGDAALGLVRPLGRRLSGELYALTAGSIRQDRTGTGQSFAGARVHVAGGDASTAWGAWAGGAPGITWDGWAWRTSRMLQLAGWLRAGRASVLATVSPFAIGDTTRWVDAVVAARVARGAIEADAHVGMRGGDRLVIGATTNARTWGGVSVARRVTRAVSVTLAGGTYASDPSQAIPGGAYVMAGVLVRLRPELEEQAARDPRDKGRDTLPVNAVAAGSVLAFVVARAEAGTTQLGVHAPGARVVEIAGDFTDWKPVPLARAADGWWRVARALPPGVRQLAVRTDGGAWMPPPGLAVTRDEFGEAVGLLVVPER